MLCLLWAACAAKHSPSLGAGGQAGGLRFEFDAGACRDAGPDETGAAGDDGGPCVPLMQRAYTTDVAPVLAECGGETCHGAFGSPSGLAAQAIGVRAEECCTHPPIISPGHPESSYMINKLLGQGICAGVRMPPPGPLSAEQIQIVSDWICEGAPTQ
ncbi:MAG TPA: hypothetical protein VGI10_23685 [Polyangiaceae bacterium]